MDLVIVESPTKSKKIQKFLGSKYKVVSSFGHIRDLPKSDFGIDTEHDFKPKYIIPTKAKKTVTSLKKEAKTADKIILSTDPDREGEAIAWHILETLKPKDYQRITFYEITQDAIKEAMNHPRKIDQHLVDAQQARRVLDRIVGYKLSPFLWKKISRGLSAGRVQSVALKLICDREEEIKKFTPEEYWSLTANLFKEEKDIFPAILIEKKGKPIKKLDIKTKENIDEILGELKNAKYIVKGTEEKTVKKNPPAPFTTSTLQQAAGNKLKYSSKMTMQLAQQLYENGYITYHRTDSTNLSIESLNDAKNFISNVYGEKYLLPEPRIFSKKSKLAQEAHEAIRPTKSSNTPENLKTKLNEKQIKLYDLIWRRFIASQTAESLINQKKIDIQANDYLFRANGQSIKFDGYLRIYPEKQNEINLPDLEKGDDLNLDKLIPEQHFTQPPARYTEAKLVKALEEYGIGRPSTYASIISVIQERNYVIKNQTRQFEPTEIGITVNKMISDNFPGIVDVNFTAKIEDNLDEIAENKMKWQDVVKMFYGPFSENLEQKMKEIKKTNQDQITDKKCPDCGKPLLIKMGRYGKFYACSGFPECKYSAPLEQKHLEIKCPKCQGKIIEKKTKRGKIFFSCNNWPKCDFATWDEPIDEFCPKCNSILTKTKSEKIKCSNKNCDFKK
ncbi:MAG TPA: type I DNA topoisomerase [Candidatus Pacearchaeota archaeon]|nr:type I DNA topoisomerase [Candidatus Parcubacteria bacterium]HNZ83887.1 type I DNA topoisomerase [Candidatus Pacearchaeota archaeon]HOU45553.1 type I DNA topoisomerase [Candidatus Pacearchaeota archaeon]HPM08416.1 type I DNA topoisomerase [Candidatus Pacearchaeota archaeon]HQI74290.1 type I DNA topoisomerase [Candidatus Pacearchaeota archaeon]